MRPTMQIPESHFSGGLAIPFDVEERLAWQHRFNVWPAVRHFAMRLDLSHPVAVRLYLQDLLPFHFGGVGDAGSGGGHAVNGAIIASMFDAALGVAGALQLPGRRAGTVDVSIKMFRPVLGFASAYGWALKRTPSMVFVEAILVDENNRRCAQASGIVGAADSAARKPSERSPALESA